MKPVTIPDPPCPFDDLQQFCDHGESAVHFKTPFRAGRYWCGTTGKIMGWHTATDGLVVSGSYVNPINIIEGVERMEPTLDWRRLPDELNEPKGVLQACSECKGSGNVPDEIECEACEGLGECPHCEQECPKCDGVGTITNRVKHTHCEHCGGTGKMLLRGTSVELDGHGIAWSAVSHLHRIGAQIAWMDGGVPSGRPFFVFRVGDLRGIVMPILPHLDSNWIKIASVPVSVSTSHVHESSAP